MGLFNFFNRKDLKNEANGPVKKAKEIGDKVIKQQLYRFNQELKNWKLGVDNFEDNFSPTTVELIRVYNDIVIDAHLSAAMEARISKTTSKDFKIIDEDGEELKDESYYFSAPWFRSFLKQSLESKFFGYSLIQFNDLKGYCFKSTEVFPREYVYAQKGAVRTSPFSTADLISYEASPYDAWTLGVGNPSDIGLLMKAAPLVIFKKTALGSWTEFAELFGAPFRLGKTDVRDEELRDNMYNMLENMGRNAYGVFDKDDELEFIRDNKTDAFNVFNELIERTNSELSKLILGSTMTMDDGSSRSQSEVHERTTGAINKEDAFFIQSVVNDELIPWLNKYHNFNITGRWVFDDTENTSKAEQFKIDSELVKMGFNVPKEYFTETYSTPIDDKEEEPETTPEPEPKEDNDAGDIENALKKKTTLATIYDAFTSGNDLHKCTNELDYEETPPPEWSEAFIDDVVRGVYSGAYTTKNLPESLYLEIGERLTNGLYEGLSTGDALTTIENPEYIKNLRNNIYTFSGPKNWHQVNLMSEFLLDEDGNKRSFKQYKDFARETFGTFNVNYLRTEINHAKGSAQMAEKWQQFDEEAELFPYLRYVTAGDEKVRPAHQALNGVIKRVDSDFWKENSPLNGWNCRCSLQQVEEAIETPDAEIKEKVNEMTDGAGLQTPDYMKNNPGREIFGKQHPYFKVPRGFKADKANNFGLPDPPPITNEEIVKNIKEAQKKNNKIDQKLKTVKTKLKKVKTVQQREEFIYKELDNIEKELDNIWNEEEAVNGFVDESAMVKIRKRQKKLRTKKDKLVDGLVTSRVDFEEEVFNILKQEKSADFQGLKGDINKLNGSEIDRGVNYFKGIVGDKKRIQGKKIITLQTPDPIGGRAFFGQRYISSSERIGSINLSQRDGIPTITHELGHWLEESDPKYFEKIKGFYAKRTKKQPFEKLNDLAPKLGYGSEEIAIKDDFNNPYTGRFYGKKSGDKIITQDATEITSMWFTEVFKNPAKFIKDDEEMFSFVYRSLLQ